MKIISIDEYTARCSAGGVERDVNVYLVQDKSLQAGDYLLVHVGYAIQKLETGEAEKTLALLSAARDA